VTTSTREKLKRYVVGFAVNEELRAIALIRKARPAWQAGRLNGIGGKIEDGEEPIDAMRREFKEETGVAVPEWREVVTLRGEGWAVYFFVADVASWELDAMRGEEDEPIEVHPLEVIGSLSVIPNLRWLIPLAIDKDRITGDLRETAGWVAPPDPAVRALPEAGWAPAAAVELGEVLSILARASAVEIGAWTASPADVEEAIRALPEAKPRATCPHPTVIATLWSKAITKAAEEDRAECQVFADLLFDHWLRGAQ
jgi:8-oxo-dGTP diphosphatase